MDWKPVPPLLLPLLDGSFEVLDPNENLEDTIADVSVEIDLPEDDGGELTFTLLEAGTKRGLAKLADSKGFSYTVKQRKPYTTYWTCSVRPKKKKCPATVVERDSVYKRGNNRHYHPAVINAATNLRVQAEVRERAVENLYKSAGAIVQEVVVENIDTTAPNPDLPGIVNMFFSSVLFRFRVFILSYFACVS